MNKLPVYMLDVETRLAVDKSAYDMENFDTLSVEGKAFLSFFEDVEREIQFREHQMKNANMSVEALTLDRDIEVLMYLMDLNERNLASVKSLVRKKQLQYQYEIILRYRYALGLYDTDETFKSYRDRKVALVDEWNSKIQFKSTLPTICNEEDMIDTTKIEYVDHLMDAFDRLIKVDETFEEAKIDIEWKLIAINLPTKHDWNATDRGVRFSFSEQRVIQAEIILKVKNELRNAYLHDNEYLRNKCLNILNTIYSVNLEVSGVSSSVSPIELKSLEHLDASYIGTGILGTSMYESGQIYSENIRMRGTRGHGIAAEKANDLIDRALGKDAQILGDDNAKNGADRLVNGEFIQTKYCSTGGKAISECFHDGKFRYVLDGKPMQIEVPSDKYDQALQSMQQRIERGDLSDLGITNPDEAEKIVRKGQVSYKTAQRIAKAGTIEGLSYDAAKGMVTGLQTFGVSATISFAISVWKGDDVDEALNRALKDSSILFGRHVMQHILTQQLGRTTIEKSLRPATDYVVKNVLGSKTSAQIVNTFLKQASQKGLHGASAMSHLSKVFRGNLVTMAITTSIISAGSVYDILNGRISGGQLFKNVGTAGSSVGGAIIGASVGSVVPVVGTFVGGIVGGWLGGKASKKVLDQFIEDDMVQLLEIWKKGFVKNIEELQMDRDEVNYLADKMFDIDLQKELKLLYASSNKSEYISDRMDPYIDAVLKARPKIENISAMIENYQEIA
ncbi:hypothetical protein EXW93_13775 [Exiguobacterium sp. JMULE1]|uniref:hypothetical protein n=1 Tax=Exiguobacterium sp. JMULE1 TaxID=2518339 RepID=UPI0015776B05|nr:hypothetical protein [Exiguobacterium sp. JMULE1]NTY10666.1 hypothetical protein [Exiguobacterium sp. JMULE1]